MKKLLTLILYISSVSLIAQNTYEYRINIDGIYETFDEGEDIANIAENFNSDFVSVHQYFIDSETQEVSFIKHANNGDMLWRQTLDADPEMIFSFISPPEICSYEDRYAFVQNQGIEIVPGPFAVYETHHILSLFDESGNIFQETSLKLADQQQFTDVIPYNGGFAVASTNVKYPIPPPFGNDPFVNRLFVYTTDIDGNNIWEKQILFEDDTWDERLILYEVVADINKNIYLFCSYEFAHDGLIIVKLNEDGEVLFVNKYEDPALETWGYDPQCRAAINSQGDLFCYLSWQNNPGVAQYTNLYKFNDEGEVLFSKRVEELVFVTSLSASSDNGFTILFPNLNDQFGTGFDDSKDPALAKFHSDGSFDWGFIYGEEGDNLTDRHIVCQDRGYMIWSHTESDFYMIKTDIHGISGCETHPLELSTVDFEVEMTSPEWSEIDFPETVDDSFSYTEQETPVLLDKCCLTNLTSATFDFDFTATDFEVNFNNNSLNADTYAWDFGDGTNAGYENPVHIFPGAGDYIVCLTVYNECMDDQYCISITVPEETPIGIDELEIYAEIYPNPATNSFEIESKKEISLATLRNQQGQIVRQHLVNDVSIKYQTAKLARGMYFLELEYNNNQKSRHKIVLQ